MKLGIGPKVNLLIISAMVLVGGAAVFSVSALKHEGQIAIEKYKL